ncbi:hypothetical protein FHS42_001051 [Streptomyces zagrosensis]|uniref:Uncharacterized protein n=1 Tax=Streptomyces zagrosensis TaxID=1042984 RepID=A0A7W9Q5I3_9ACTN|nr:hypothetical protein [Streptomyces zagrosensis]
MRVAGRFGWHDAVKADVDAAEQRAKGQALGGSEVGAVAVLADDPGVQGVAAPADHGDGSAVSRGHGRGDGHPERGEPQRRAVLPGDGRRVAVEMVLEEVPAARGDKAVAAVQQPLFERPTGHGLSGALVAP